MGGTLAEATEWDALLALRDGGAADALPPGPLRDPVQAITFWIIIAVGSADCGHGDAGHRSPLKLVLVISGCWSEES